MNRFQVEKTKLEGVWCIERSIMTDDRGFLSRIFCAEAFSAIGWDWQVAQINHAFTAKSGTVRGMHYQNSPHCEAKFVSCLRGAIWDVAVDLRKDSPTFLKWTAHHLSADNRRALLIPPGFAHGFQSLEDGAELLYLHSHPYVANADAGLNPQDPKLSISWPAPITLLSDKDRQQPHLLPSFQGLTL